MRLSATQPSASIGALLIPGKLNKITILDLNLRTYGANLFKIEVKGPASDLPLFAGSSRP
jgi:hypothetical protein